MRKKNKKQAMVRTVALVLVGLMLLSAVGTLLFQGLYYY